MIQIREDVGNPCIQALSHRVAWGGNCHHSTTRYRQLFALSWETICNVFCCFIFVAKEISPETLAEYNFGPCKKLESSILLTHKLSIPL